jgi:hypothetical protein
MHLVYVDDSKDEKSICFSAIIIPAHRWLEAFNYLVAVRREMKRAPGVYTRLELHATDWLGGRGNVAPTTITRTDRVSLFNYFLDRIVELPEVQILNAHSMRANEDELFERLVQRIENNAKKKDSRAIIISDEGKNYDHLTRKMRRFNYIPSSKGDWGDGSTSKNMPAERILEDIVYRDSKRSYFIQAADFCAYSLLRFEAPTERAIRMGFDQSFMRLEKVLIKQAYRADPRKLGIIRV